jgi:hypothetical protein
MTHDEHQRVDLSGTASLSALEERSRELLERLSKDDDGPVVTAASHLAGKITLTGVALEKLLRAALGLAADLEKCAPEDLLASTSAGRRPSWRKAMAGQLAHGLRDHYRSAPARPIPTPLRVLVEDLLEEPSAILTYISVRNDVVKEGRRCRPRPRASRQAQGARAAPPRRPRLGIGIPQGAELG